MVCLDAIYLDLRNASLICKIRPASYRTSNALEQFPGLPYVESFSKLNKVYIRDAPCFSANQHLMLTCPFPCCWIMGEASVISRGKIPLPGPIKHEGQVLGVVVAVHGGNIECTAQPCLLKCWGIQFQVEHGT